MDEKHAERRQYRRIDANVEVEIQNYSPDMKDFTSDGAVSRNLSQGGMLVHYDKPVEVPSYIIASFTLPVSEEKLNFVGKVVRIEELIDGTYEIGVMFMRMIIGDFDHLARYISDEMENS